MEALKENHTVWVSGLMAWQSDHRASLDIFEERGGILKFYPLLDVSREDRDNYIREHHLPFHPLISKGYFSIGCEHCTVPEKTETVGGTITPKPNAACICNLFYTF